jgi:phospholipid/cholesterol/gamma-HCH transport system substrate-binding protein
MPGATEPKPNPKPGYRRILIAGIVAVAVLIVAAVVARQTFLRYEFDLVMFVDDSAGVAPSSPVLLNGIGVGHVRKISLSGSRDQKRTVRIDMRFSRTYLKEIPADSTVAITSSNLLGDKYVNISRGRNAQHIVPGSEIRSTETQDIGSVLARGSAPLQQVDDLMSRVDRILDYASKGQGSLGKIVNDPTLQTRIDGITAGIQQIEVDSQTGRGVLLHTGELYRDAHRPLARFNEMMADLDHGKGSIGHLLHDPNDPSLTSQASAVIKEAEQILDGVRADKRPAELMSQAQATSDRIGNLIDRIDAGQGTAGQLIVNPQLKDSLARIQTELNSFMADFSKHPTRFVQLRFGLF